MTHPHIIKLMEGTPPEEIVEATLTLGRNKVSVLTRAAKRVEEWEAFARRYNGRSFRADTREGRSVIVSPSLLSSRGWRMTSFDALGKPFGHLDVATYADAVIEAGRAGADLSNVTFQ